MAELFLRRPRLLVLALLLITAMGYTAFDALPRAEDPELTSRDAIIITPYLGAGAEKIEALVTDPLEDALREFEEIGTFDSESTSDISTLHIELKEHLTEVDSVWSRIRDKLEDVEATLPEGAGPIDFEAFEISAFTLIVAVVPEGDPGASPASITRRAEELADRLRAVSGTKEVELYGGLQEEIAVDLDPAQLAARGLTLAQVARAVQGQDAKIPAGVVHTGSNDLIVAIDSELDSVERVAQTPVRVASTGQSLTLRDLGSVRKSERTPPATYGLVEGQRAVFLGARLMDGQRVDRWAERARKVVQTYAAQLPRGMGLRTLFDQSTYTKERLSALVFNFALGALLVMLVVFFTMGWRSALMVGTALPLAILLSLKGMQVLEIPMHQMSVAGLIIALGLLIDNAIVMVDELSHRLEDGERPRQAVRNAVRKLALPLTSSTVTTALAFMPIVLMPGSSGEFVGSMAMCVILAISSSLLISFLILPAISIRVLLRGRQDGALGFLGHGLRIAPVQNLYGRIVGWTVRHPFLALGLGLVLPVLGFSRAPYLQEQFFPPADRDQFGIELHLPRQASIESATDLAQRARTTLMQHPRVKEVSWLMGQNFPKFYYNQIEDRANSPFFAQAMVQIDGPQDSIQVVRELQEWLDRKHPEAQALVRQIEQGPPFDAPVEIRLIGPGLETLRQMGETLRHELAGLPHVLHTRATLLSGQPSLKLATNEAEMRRSGRFAREMAQELRAQLSGWPSGSVLEATEELPVVLRLPAEERGSPDELASLPWAGARGWTPMGSLARLSLQPELSNIPHLDGERINSVQGFITAGVLPSTVLEALLERLEATGFQPPAGYRMVVGGEAAERDEAVGSLMGTLSILMLLMGASLVIAFHSFRLAGVIAIVGAMSVGLSLGAISLSGFPFGFMGIVGTMGLIGVAINDSIVVLAALEEDEDCLRGDRAAMAKVLVRATRHVLSTTLTTIAGFLPLYLGGGGFWPPVAVAIGGGVAGATLMALTVSPALFQILYAGRNAKAREPRPEPSPELDSVDLLLA